MDQNRQISPTDALKQIVAGGYQINTKNIILSAPKLDNDFLHIFVKNLRAQKVPEEVIIDTILNLDNSVQNHKIKKADFDELVRKSSSK